MKKMSIGLDVQLVEQWRSIHANNLRLNPPQRNIGAGLVRFLCAPHQNCRRNDSINRVLQSSSPTFSFRFTKCDSGSRTIIRRTEQRAQRRGTAMIWDAVQSKEIREDNESRKKSTKRYPASHGLVETLGFCTVLKLHDAPDGRTGKSVKRRRRRCGQEKPCLSLPWH